MKKILLPILLSGLLLLTNCNDSVISEEDCYSYDYSECNSVEPYSGELEIRLSLNEENPCVVLNIYKGNYDHGETIFTDTAWESPYRVLLEANEYYAAAAEYYKNGERITVVDGDKISKKSKQVCDSVCWTVKNGKIDLRLK